MDNPGADLTTSRPPATGREQELWEPTMHDVLLAQRRIAPHLAPTPLLKPAALARALGCDAYIKCENLQPVGAFKVRGGVNLVAALVEQGRPGREHADEFGHWRDTGKPYQIRRQAGQRLGIVGIDGI